MFPNSLLDSGGSSGLEGRSESLFAGSGNELDDGESDLGVLRKKKSKISFTFYKDISFKM